MKINLALILIFFTAIVAKSQDNFVGINGGISLPVNDFLHTKSLSNSGYAILGAGEQVDVSISPNPYIGFAGSLQFRQNLMNSDKYTDDVNEYLSNLEPTYPKNNRFIKRNIDNKIWSSYTILAGPQITYPYGNIVAGIRILTGISVVVVPNNQSDIIYMDESTQYNISGTTERKYAEVAISTGFFIRYVTMSDYVVMAGLDFTHSNVRYKYDYKMDAFNPDGSTFNIDYNDPEANIGISNIYAFFGIGYRFGE